VADENHQTFARIPIAAALLAATFCMAFAPMACAGERDRRSEVIVHPARCPQRLFCGCGVSVRIFGHPVQSLYPATAWRRFPRTAAHAGAVAIFGAYHVAYVEQIDGRSVLLYDPNSGGGKTRLHWVDVRRISFFVEPHVSPSTPKLYSTSTFPS
jgi:hypothetical protein